MKRAEILSQACECVVGNREDDYGSPESNFEKIAGLWSVFLDTDIRPTDVACMLALLKIARIKSGGHGKDDNWIDLAGYAACGGELDSCTAERKSFLHRGK